MRGDSRHWTTTMLFCQWNNRVVASININFEMDFRVLVSIKRHNEIRINLNEIAEMKILCNFVYLFLRLSFHFYFYFVFGFCSFLNGKTDNKININFRRVTRNWHIWLFDDVKRRKIYSFRCAPYDVFISNKPNQFIKKKKKSDVFRHRTRHTCSYNRIALSMSITIFHQIRFSKMPTKISDW